jgi:hypothetical protein
MVLDRRLDGLHDVACCRRLAVNTIYSAHFFQALYNQSLVNWSSVFNQLSGAASDR